MLKKNIEKIRVSLLRQKDELQLKSYRQDDVDVEGDEIDEIQANLIINVNNQLSSRDKDKLRQIEKALKKIESNSFGICEECEETIAEKRLEINPYFSTCISCAELREIENKQMRR
jgi:DnaK suppressor protein